MIAFDERFRVGSLLTWCATHPWAMTSPQVVIQAPPRCLDVWEPLALARCSDCPTIEPVGWRWTVTRLRDSAGFPPDFPWTSSAWIQLWRQHRLQASGWLPDRITTTIATSKGANMGWRWRFERADGGVISDVPSAAVVTEFPTQGDAESWVGEHWRALLDAGVDAVTLVEGDRIVYGPMSLHPE